MRHALTVAQQVELIVGPGSRSVFRNDAERRRAWEQHRAQLLARERPGQRPWAWWRYDWAGPKAATAARRGPAAGPHPPV